MRENSFEIIKADLDDSASVEILCKKVLKISPNLKAIINNASTFYPKEISEIEEEDWSALLSSNLKAPMFICKFLGESLKKNIGSIVNITDIYAESGLARYTTYAAAKAGLASRTNTLFSVPMLMYMVYSAHAQGSYLVLDDWNMTSLIVGLALIFAIEVNAIWGKMLPVIASVRAVITSSFVLAIIFKIITDTL